jgi:uncharacterized RDD family membrane protein YckC
VAHARRHEQFQGKHVTAVDADRVEIQTGDGVSFSLPLAGPVSRFLAIVVDWAIISTGLYVVSIPVGLFPNLASDLRSALMVLLYFVLNIGYAIAFEWLWNGRTPGKRTVGLRVADANGLRLTFSQVLIRNLLRSVDALPLFYLTGGVVMLSNRRLQRLGDLAAGTIVLRTREAALPRLPEGRGNRFNSLKTYRTLAARLRQKVDPATARVALEALQRRDRLEPRARLALFAEMANSFRALVRFPEEATEHLTDEQYLWDVVEILYERSARGPRL